MRLLPFHAGCRHSHHLGHGFGKLLDGALVGNMTIGELGKQVPVARQRMAPAVQHARPPRNSGMRANSSG
jgi:hypothetical protein